jgi:hypothetical protein
LGFPRAPLPLAGQKRTENGRFPARRENENSKTWHFQGAARAPCASKNPGRRFKHSGRPVTQVTRDAIGTQIPYLYIYIFIYIIYFFFLFMLHNKIIKFYISIKKNKACFFHVA